MRDAPITSTFIFIDYWDFKWDIQRKIWKMCVFQQQSFYISTKIKNTFFFFSFGKTCTDE